MTSSNAIDGKLANIITLSNKQGMTATFMDIGATWLSCTLPVKGKVREILLRSANMQEHNKQGAYFGSIVGRYANRIADGKFCIDNKHYQIGLNDGNNTLHGGFEGIDKRRWEITSHSNNQVIFNLHSPDGDQGYPGNLSIKVAYTLTENNELQITYSAKADQTSPVNLTNHAYFNLAGENSSKQGLEHMLQIRASHYLPTHEDLIPTGEFRSVIDTSFDFTKTKKVGAELMTDNDQKIASGYDHSFIFEPGSNDGKTTVATLLSPEGDVCMKVKTTKPAVQFYSGNFLAGISGASKKYQLHDGLALETQFLPDGPNHPEWNENNGVLLAGKQYNHQTTYQFEF